MSAGRSTRDEVGNPAVWPTKYHIAEIKEQSSDMGDVGNPYESSNDGEISPGGVMGGTRHK